MRPLTALIAACLAAAGSMGGGCAVTQDQYDSLTNELEQSRSALRKLQEENRQLQSVLADQQKQLGTLQALGEKRLETLFHVQRIALGRHTGGVDLDGAEGDDAVKVYLRPIDQDGSVIKAAGDVKIRLFDLAAEPNDNLIAQYEWKAQQLAEQWASGFMTYHFSFECPWKSAPPLHNQITVRVEFTDYLTGKTFTAQKLCKVKLPLTQTEETQPGQ